MITPHRNDVDAWIYQLINYKEYLDEHQAKQLCDLAKNVFAQESNVHHVSPPVVICGDIHGQFYDLLELLRVSGPIPGTSYIFMGDLVDRGHHSVETLQLLLCFKVRYPQQITIIRGNHETRQVTTTYGFYDECIRKYGNSNVWRYCTEVFDYMSIAAAVENAILCVHGGLSPMISTIDDISHITRTQEVPPNGPYCDLLWSDPDEDTQDFTMSKRGAGWLFGARPTTQFCHQNGLELICRAHQLVFEGYSYKFANKNLITVWSAPNYCYRCQNVASVFMLDEAMHREIRLFHDVPEPNPEEAMETRYFL